MATILLPPDFKEFLRLLSSSEAEYLLIGGYAVNYYGYPRATALREFGFPQAEAKIFSEPGRVVRMGVPPLRIEILTSISGVEFSWAFSRRTHASISGVLVNLIGLEDLKANKSVSGRSKDLTDLEQLD